MILDRVGECLQYGLTREVYTARKDCKFRYLKAALGYLMLKGYIDRNEWSKLNSLYPFNGNVHEEDKKKQFEEILRFVMSRLKKKISFNTFEELVGKLNIFMMPEWMYKECDRIMFLLPDAYLVDDMFYYINPEDGSFCFELHSEGNYEDDMEDVEDDMEDMGERRSTILSYKYSQILGYNEEERVFYLSVKRIQNIYVEYHLDIGIENIIHKKCIGVIKNYPVCESDGYLMVKAERAWNHIKKCDVKEEYTVIGNKIFVTPKHNFPTMFVPYWMNPSGRVIGFSYQDSKTYLWRQIQNQFKPFWKRDNSNEEKDEYLTLGFMEAFVSKNFDMNSDEYARLFFSLIKLLKRYFPSDADMLQHFYVIMEASNRYEEDVRNCRVSQSFLARLEELDSYDELQKYIYDLDAFKKKLLETVYWDDEKIMEAEKKREPREKIGYFTIRKDKVKAFVHDINDGVCMGSLMVMPGIHKKGIVAYNMENSFFEVQYCRLLTTEEINSIVDKFNLKSKKYRIVVEADELIKENLIYDW
ncbi:MAG: hypothetical protein IKY23_10350 [Lachnospiraceae bacterium]|nr:hypothetical protein [Lachnospiraceae bacterium]